MSVVAETLGGARSTDRTHDEGRDAALKPALVQ